MGSADVPHPFLHLEGDHILLEVHAAPRATRTRLAGVHDGRLKVQVAAPPVDGAANAELVRFFAVLLDLPKSHVVLAKGATAKRKTLSVSGLGVAELCRRLALPSGVPRPS